MTSKYEELMNAVRSSLGRYIVVKKSLLIYDTDVVYTGKQLVQIMPVDDVPRIRLRHRYNDLEDMADKVMKLIEYHSRNFDIIVIRTGKVWIGSREVEAITQIEAIHGRKILIHQFYPKEARI